jgi:transposase
MDLALASREELIAVVGQLQGVVTDQQLAIAEQRETITKQRSTIEQLQKRVQELESQLHKGGPKGMPGLKPEPASPTQSKKPRKRRPHGFARSRATPTEQVIHAVEYCPECGTLLKGGSVKYRREVIELPVQPVKVVEHVFVERECPLCRKRLMDKDALKGVVVGKQRLGINVVSLITTLREAGRLPFETIQWYLDTFHELRLSVGELVGVVQRVAVMGRGAVEGIRSQIRASPVAMADETGWRENGANGYVWTFSTPRERYFLRRGRNKEVVDEVLGEEFSGVLVSDFYAAYNHYAGLHQRCWAHLLRDIHELKELCPEDEELHHWAKGVHELFEEAKAFSSPKERERLEAKGEFEARLLQLCQPFLDKQDVAQHRLCARIKQHLPELFVFVSESDVPADNNAAERSLRHLVTSRKISGGTRSKAGSEAKMALDC